MIVLVVALFFAGFFVWSRQAFSSASETEDYQNFLIEKGDTASEIAASLEQKDIIKSAFAFKFYTQIAGISQTIQAGEYRLSPHMDMPTILNVLISAPLELWVTIPEGYRREEIADKFIQELGKTGSEASVFYDEFLSSSENDEGYLFPDTYLFPKEASAQAVVTKMKRTFDLKMDQFEEDIQSNKLTLSEIVTLASILERETITNAERPVVAGILLNRLEIGMPLQADATAQYPIGTAMCRDVGMGCDWWKRPVTREDLGVDSPYNTYKVSGLPIAPISNPGLSSLRAAINPESSEYFYYIHDTSGIVRYARTLEEHNANVARYLR